MKDTPQRFTLVDEVEEKKAKHLIDDATRQRRSRFTWWIIGIILLFIILNATGVIQSGHFEPRTSGAQTQQVKEYQGER